MAEQGTNVQRVRFEIETRGRSGLISAENEARTQRALAKAYCDNPAVLRHELAAASKERQADGDGGRGGHARR
ncbi:hypothetical protein [Streptomyces indicus]|uniref:Uncharacterized protein n=1 Tax=Streptomyces indicus TaxID=417292 RepID=A0A1G9GQ89_9ACTN|nr:hypothetical protein SAMN05421806_116144 [Streptomyces indicus]